MKRILLVVLAALMVLSCFACGKKDEPVDINAKSEGVMTYAEYEAAALDSKVTIEAYIQAKQSWWDNKGTFYTQDGDGAYFLYELPCTEEEYAKLAIGTKVKVSGTKAAWAGEVEIIDATYEILEGEYVAEAMDVLGLKKADVLGVSHGGMIGQYLAIDRDSLAYMQEVILQQGTESESSMLRYHF